MSGPPATTNPSRKSRFEVQQPGGKRIGCPPASSIALVYVEGRITASIFQGPKVESLLQAVTPIIGDDKLSLRFSSKTSSAE